LGKGNRLAGEGTGKRKGDMGVGMIWVHCIHAWKCHNEIHYFTQTIEKINP
jgi:hypothetical protein